MRHYIRLVLNISFLVFSFGYLLPLLISMPDTMLVLAGFAYVLVIVPGVLYYFNRSYLNSVIQNIKEKF